ncbi:BQ5605_C040g11908 [Microbotryum silenes-dioicae]|uniref:BQ5605_C040g11908 protein n=1 Tax=Microbotryum silenes-dioicae TaxID=796604 RepID=A0A2X0PJ22_9BASI|nr:BQ5605_C040g11908 [Microbotryum silenes-dioicae]
MMLPHVFPELLRSTEVLVIPPTLPSLHPQGLSDDARKRLKKFGAIIDLYRRPQTTGDPVNPGLQPESLLEKLWADVSASSPIASVLPQPAAVRTAIGDCCFLRPCTYTFLGATRPLIKALRYFINEARYPSLDDSSRLKWPTDVTKSQKQQFWIWLNSQWATAVEKDVHWKLIFRATPTCVLQHRHGHAASDGCPQCGERDTFMHFYFECDHSRDFQPGEVDSSQIMLGLPRVRGGTRDSRTYIVVRHKDQIPLPTPYFLTREVRSHLKFQLRCLPDGELLDQMMVVGAHMIGITLLVVSRVWGLHGSTVRSHTRGLTGGTRNARSLSDLHCVVDGSLPASAAVFTTCRDRCVPHSQDYLPADEVADREFHLAGRSQLLAARYETLDVTRLDCSRLTSRNLGRKAPNCHPAHHPCICLTTPTPMLSFVLLQLEPLFRYDLREWSGESKSRFPPGAS